MSTITRWRKCPNGGNSLIFFDGTNFDTLFDALELLFTVRFNIESIVRIQYLDVLLPCELMS